MAGGCSPRTQLQGLKREPRSGWLIFVLQGDRSPYQLDDLAGPDP